MLRQRGVFFMFKFLKILLAPMILLILVAVLILQSLSSIPAISENSGIELPIIMYHSILKNTELSGKYVITPSTLSEDIEYLQKNGYTTISMKQLIDYVDNGTSLPEKPVMLTFDDGCYNNYEYVLPILEKYDACAIFCIVGKYTDDYTDSNEANISYGYMRWIDVYNLSMSGRAEIANHSYDFHKHANGRRGSKKKAWESINDYKNIFKKDTQRTQTECYNNTGITPIVYAYPFGEYSKESFDVLKDLGFKASFTCNEGVNIITQDPESLFLLKRNNRPDNIGTAEFFSNLIH